MCPALLRTQPVWPKSDVMRVLLVSPLVDWSGRGKVKDFDLAQVGDRREPVDSKPRTKNRPNRCDTAVSGMSRGTLRTFVGFCPMPTLKASCHHMPTVTLQQAIGLVFITAVLLLVLLLATWVYFGVRMKLLRNRVASLEFEMKVMAEKVD